MKEKNQRKDSFDWHSKQELCEYFKSEYGINKDDVESEIDTVMKVFQLRKGRPIHTKELWQKVGNTLVGKLNA